MGSVPEISAAPMSAKAPARCETSWLPQAMR